MATAILKSYNQSPRKVRLVGNLMKGKKVQDAINALQFLPKRASLPLKKLIESAVANSKNAGEKVEDMKVKSVVVESAGMIKRYMPRAFGRASAIRHRKSRVIVTLEAGNKKLESRKSVPVSSLQSPVSNV